MVGRGLDLPELGEGVADTPSTSLEAPWDLHAGHPASDYYLHRSWPLFPLGPCPLLPLPHLHATSISSEGCQLALTGTKHREPAQGL